MAYEHPPPFEAIRAAFIGGGSGLQLPGTNYQKPGNHPNFEKKALGVKRPFSEQLSEFRGILGAILGMALTT